MSKVSVLKPIDSFTGKMRLIDELKASLVNPDYDVFIFAVAFAKVGPLLRLLPSIQKWGKDDKKIKAIFGIDLQGTSIQALDFAMQHFDEVYITHTQSYSTFHPKFYLFYGSNKAVCFHGSHNLTIGGTETNLEGGLRIDLALPEDQVEFDELLSSWDTLLPTGTNKLTKKLTKKYLSELITKKVLSDESIQTNQAPNGQAKKGGNSPALSCSSQLPKPPSPLPKGIASPAKKTSAKKGKAPTSTIQPCVKFQSVSEFVIQIKVKGNGESTLSKIAYEQYPAFFGYPFTGKSSPNKLKGTRYPRRAPDPIVNVTIFDKNGAAIVTHHKHKMLMMEYTNSDARIQLSSPWKKHIPDYSILTMKTSPASDIDYEIKIYVPGSKKYNQYLAACTQELRAGGKYKPRKMGWI